MDLNIDQSQLHGYTIFMIAVFSVLLWATHSQPTITTFSECLVVPSVGSYGRNPVHTDAIQYLIASGEWKSPKEGDAIHVRADLERTWLKLQAGEDAVFRHNALNGGYAFTQYESEKDEVLILSASGHSMVYVNGEPRVGDVYMTGHVQLPIKMKKGKNEFLFHVARGQLRANLSRPRSELFFNTGDMTLPDIIKGEERDYWGGITVVNASEVHKSNVLIRCTHEKRSINTTVAISPLTIRKVGFRIPAIDSEHESTKYQIEIIENGRSLDKTEIELRNRKPNQVHKRTFISNIDGSVQYFAVNPPLNIDASRQYALVLSLHGAGVEAIGQAEAYAQKTWAYIVAPTNRRPFGFDWEDWGRWDAMEVLEIAQKELPIDPSQTYLTGHSMGGHGAWHLGVTYPSKFAAVGPSAGWISFWSYAGGARIEGESKVQQVLRLSTNGSDTLSLAQNLSSLGVYILHGDADDNVPVAQARAMADVLKQFHRDWIIHEQAGAGHWWDSSDEPGAYCVDWPPMFDFFSKRRIPETRQIRNVNFTTANPGVSSESFWACIYSQITPLQFSKININYDPHRNRFIGDTENVHILRLKTDFLLSKNNISVIIDGQRIENINLSDDEQFLWLEFSGNKWQIISEPNENCKSPHRNGMLKDALRNHMVFVYSTKGSQQENNWSYAKARYDAETFWYRGNGSISIIRDIDFTNEKFRENNLIVYGNADTNSLWKTLQKNSPIKVNSGAVNVASEKLAQNKLGVMYVFPRMDSVSTTTAFIGGTDLTGMRTIERMPIFVSGVAYPDYLIVTADALKNGMSSVLKAGIFENDWTLKTE